jgi:myosin heavy subunit
MESEQALNEAERKALDHLRQTSLPPCFESENPGVQSEPNSAPESFIDIKDLLTSYNDLSHSFRSYLASSPNEFTNNLVLDLKSENSLLRKEKSYLTQKLMNALQENFLLTYKRDPFLTSSQKIQFFDLVSQKLTESSWNDEKVARLEKQLLMANEVIARQDKVIQSFKDEVKGKNGVERTGLQQDDKEKNELKACLHQLQIHCAEYRRTLDKNRFQVLEYWKEIVRVRDVVVQLSAQKESLEKMVDCLKFEVKSLKEIVKLYENVNLAQASRVSTSEIQRFFSNYADEVIQVKKNIWNLEIERKELQENLRKAELKINELNENHQKKLEKILENYKNEDLKKNLEVQKLNQELEEMIESQEEILNNSNLTRVELEESKKSMKSMRIELEKAKNEQERGKNENEKLMNELDKIKNELNSLKINYLKKVDQLQKMSQVKEAEKGESLAPDGIKKLVFLLYKFNSAQVTHFESEL